MREVSYGYSANQGVVQRPLFDIPKYQRGFAWENKNIRELFDDVHESLETDSNHYIGT